MDSPVNPRNISTRSSLGGAHHNRTMAQFEDEMVCQQQVRLPLLGGRERKSTTAAAVTTLLMGRQERFSTLTRPPGETLSSSASQPKARVCA